MSAPRQPPSVGAVPQNTHVMPGSKPDFEGRVRLVDESLAAPEAKAAGEEAGKEEGGKKPFWKKALKVGTEGLGFSAHTFPFRPVGMGGCRAWTGGRSRRFEPRPIVG